MSDASDPRTAGVTPSSPLIGRGLKLAYGHRVVSADLDVEIPRASFTVILGPNACGKSTLLRALARLLAPVEGQVVLDGREIGTYPSRHVARRLGLLPQSSTSPPGITVGDLVARGRFPHQTLLRRWSSEDDDAVRRAMEDSGVSDLAERQVDELSGGQRQRVWLALVLAQQTPLLLLDEPTTFLDVSHQLEVLNLCRRLHRSGRYTLVAVLHDLNLAFRYATHLVVMKDGQIRATGSPRDIVTPGLVEDVYGIRCTCIPDPHTGRPLVIPLDEEETPVPDAARSPAPEAGEGCARPGSGASGPRERE